MDSTESLLNDSSFDNETLEEQRALHELSIYELALWFFLYGLIAFLAVFGNLLVIYVIVSRPRMQTVTNYFIVNLAAADALTGLLAIPLKMQAALLQRWVLPYFMCGVVPFIETVTLSVSVFTLTATSVDRLRAILFPTTRMSRLVAKVIIFLVWFLSIAISVPYGVGHQIVEMPMDENSTEVQPICTPVYGETLWWKIYNVYLTIIQYFVPLFVVNGAYCFIGFKVWLTKPVVNYYSNPNSDSFEKNKKRVIKMLVIVVAVFTFCWLPYETYLVLSEIRENVNDYFYINIVFFCCHWLAMSNSCLNPIIYGIYNEKFQREYKRVFLTICGRTQFETSTEFTTMMASSDADMKGRGNGAMDNGRLVPGEGSSPGDKANGCHSYIAAELGCDEDDDF